MREAEHFDFPKLNHEDKSDSQIIADSPAHSISERGEHDLFQFRASKDGWVTINLEAIGFEPRLRIFNRSLQVISDHEPGIGVRNTTITRHLEQDQTVGS